MAQQTAVVNLKINNADAKKRVEKLNKLMVYLKRNRKKQQIPAMQKVRS